MSNVIQTSWSFFRNWTSQCICVLLIRASRMHAQTKHLSAVWKQPCYVSFVIPSRHSTEASEMGWQHFQKHLNPVSKSRVALAHLAQWHLPLFMPIYHLASMRCGGSKYLTHLGTERHSKAPRSQSFTEWMWFLEAPCNEGKGSWNQVTSVLLEVLPKLSITKNGKPRISIPLVTVEWEIVTASSWAQYFCPSPKST